MLNMLLSMFILHKYPFILVGFSVNIFKNDYKFIGVVVWDFDFEIIKTYLSAILLSDRHLSNFPIIWNVRNLSRRNSLITIKNSSICMNSFENWARVPHEREIHSRKCILNMMHDPSPLFYWCVNKNTRESLLINLILSASINCWITSNCHFIFFLLFSSLFQVSYSSIRNFAKRYIL